MTKTYKYLYPAFHLSCSTMVRAMLGDLMRMEKLVDVYLYDNSHVYEDPMIFLLLRLSQGSLDVLDKFRTLNTYIDDYSVDNNMFMVVVSISDMRAYNNFLESKYSKMYSSVFLERAFKKSDGEYLSVYNVFAKTVKRKMELIEDYNLPDEFDFEDAELEGIMNIEEETFKHKKEGA